MKVILYMAISVNGMIADEKGDEDFLSHKNWLVMVSFLKQNYVLIWGRKTYDVVTKGWGKNYLDEIKNFKKVIISNKKMKLIDGFELSKSPKEAINLLKSQGYKKVLLDGGSTLNAAFMKEGLINEVILNVEAVIVGMGINLFAEEKFDVKLKLVDYKKIDKNLLQLHYKVLN